jgi:CheY-like chemotaxis protein
MKKKLVIIEDNEDNRLLVRAILEDLYEVTEYETGPEALARLAIDPPDLVLLDISLPDMDGPEVLQHMRLEAALCQVPVIALTAHAMAGDREAFLAMGFDGYVSKPIVDETELLDAIRHHLQPEDQV